VEPAAAPVAAPPVPAPVIAPAPEPEPEASQPAAVRAPLLTLTDISKSFGPVRAVDGVSLSLHPGEKHALLGENGAGKSTLVKMIYGVLQPDGGTLSLDGASTRIASPSAARARGIGMVFQHFSTFEALTVAENLAVVLPDLALKDIRRDVRRIGEEYGLKIEPDRRLATLSAGERQRVEIIRCLMQKPRLLIMDEPTSVLTPQEAEALFVVLDRLAADGCAILYISHRLDDVRRLCDTATVIRRGKVVATCDPRAETAASLAAMMIGENVERPTRQAAYVGKARLEVEGLHLPFGGGMAAEPVTFAARKGEILGIAGVAGEGQSELFAALSGETLTRRAGTIRVDGRPVGRLGPRQRRRAQMAFGPERRLGHAAIGDMRLSENFRLTHGGIRAARKGAVRVREDFDVRADGRDPFAAALSGGNLQKFVIGREIVGGPAVLIVEQPTWGVDAGAMATIHAALMDLAARGSAVVVISQDLDEIFALCDRVAVLHRGTLSEPRVTSTVTAEDLGLLMGGATPEAAEPTLEAIS
jgi:simple sugar transport system ATP-binding protein